MNNLHVKGEGRRETGELTATGLEGKVCVITGAERGIGRALRGLQPELTEAKDVAAVHDDRATLLNHSELLRRFYNTGWRLGWR